MSENLLQYRGNCYHPRRVVCITVVPSYGQPEYAIDAQVEAKVIRLVGGVGPSCRVSRFQWFVATDEPCGAIQQDLAHEGIDNVFTFRLLLANDWRFWCKPRNETDEWEFDGLAAFLQKHLADPMPLDSPGAERERRIRQFEHYLRMMEHRTLRLVKSDCFLILSVPAPRNVRRRISGSKVRIVQFAFMEDGFYVDLPDTTLTPEEAKRLLAERSGFEYALDRPRKRLGEREFDPVQRIYDYAQQRTAAEDAAYVFFDLWETPVGASIKVEASAFEISRRWERGFLMG